MSVKSESVATLGNVQEVWEEEDGCPADRFRVYRFFQSFQRRIR